MADYWKSQARKFCDFCKCWIADNKPSIQFHETGKRHKENVAQKLALLTKRSVKEQKESIKVDEEMRKMEAAAMKAYLKDMESNPDYTSKVIHDKVKEKKKQVEEEQKKQKIFENEEKNDCKVGDSENVQHLWYEAQSDEGYTYYWNYMTGESVWEPPKEGYKSLDEQKNSGCGTASTDTDIKLTSDVKLETNEKKNDNDDDNDDDDEDKRLKDNRKRKKEECNDNQIVEVGDGDLLIGPVAKPDPYGKWTAVDNRLPEPVDLQLPQEDYIEIKVPIVESEQLEIKFKEKTIGSLHDDSLSGFGQNMTFKKRKFSAKSNMRRKLDDEDD